MRVKDVFVNGSGVRLPSTLNVADAIASGECEPKLVARTDVESVSVSPHESAAEMAVEAARVALARAGSEPDDVDPTAGGDSGRD